jgi:hypothetical protein
MSLGGSCGSRGDRRATGSRAVAAVAELEKRARSTLANAAASAVCSGLKRLAVAAHAQVAARRATRAASAIVATLVSAICACAVNSHDLNTGTQDMKT